MTTKSENEFQAFLDQAANAVTFPTTALEAFRVVEFCHEFHDASLSCVTAGTSMDALVEAYDGFMAAFKDGNEELALTWFQEWAAILSACDSGMELDRCDSCREVWPEDDVTDLDEDENEFHERMCPECRQGSLDADEAERHARWWYESGRFGR